MGGSINCCRNALMMLHLDKGEAEMRCTLLKRQRFAF
jgi:hypothetical protein